MRFSRWANSSSFAAQTLPPSAREARSGRTVTPGGWLSVPVMWLLEQRSVSRPGSGGVGVGQPAVAAPPALSGDLGQLVGDGLGQPGSQRDGQHRAAVLEFDDSEFELLRLLGKEIGADGLHRHLVQLT